MHYLNCFAAFLLVCAGCGDAMSVAPVSGTITLDGQPLAGATITTQPIAADTRSPGPGSFAKTDEQGRYELELVKPAKKGAIIGEHRVTIAPASASKVATVMEKTVDGVEFSVDDPKAHLGTGTKNWPAKFTDGSLRLVVPEEGTSDANFDLSMKAGR